MSESITFSGAWLVFFGVVFVIIGFFVINLYSKADIDLGGFRPFPEGSLKAWNAWIWGAIIAIVIGILVLIKIMVGLASS